MSLFRDVSGSRSNVGHRPARSYQRSSSLSPYSTHSGLFYLDQPRLQSVGIRTAWLHCAHCLSLAMAAVVWWLELENENNRGCSTHTTFANTCPWKRGNQLYRACNPISRKSHVDLRSRSLMELFALDGRDINGVGCGSRGKHGHALNGWCV